jgi:hypothetical protein
VNEQGRFDVITTLCGGGQQQAIATLVDGCHAKATGQN